jgi:hypothetical protein
MDTNKIKNNNIHKICIEKEEESTQLIIKLDAKIYSIREELEMTKLKYDKIKNKYILSKNKIVELENKIIELENKIST